MQSNSESVLSVSRNTPIIIGVAAVNQKAAELEWAQEALKLMQLAVESAAEDAGNMHILKEIDEIFVPQGFWSYSDPARLIARMVGSPQAKTCLAGIGILQQTLINQACQKISDGEMTVAVIVGGEAKYRSLQAKIQNREITDTVQVEDQPDVYLVSNDPIWSKLEAERGLMMPTEFFALMESALCSAKSGDMQIHREYLGDLYAAFSDIARLNPDAWREEPFTAKEIIEPSLKNPYLAFPYTKLQNSQWNVDQAGALIICSVGKALELGVPEHKWIYPLSAAESNYAASLTERPVLHRHKGTELVAEAAFQSAGLTVEQIDFFELYSCFPAVVQSHALDIGVSEKSAWTQTGGMAYAGGPLNNFVIQATVKMVQNLRNHKNAKGLVTCISGINAKQGIGLYSSAIPEKPFRVSDVSAKTRESMPIVHCIEDYEGEAVIIATTVVFTGEVASHAFVIAETDGKRLVLRSEDRRVMQLLTDRVVNGDRIRVSKDGQLTFI